MKGGAVETNGRVQASLFCNFDMVSHRALGPNYLVSNPNSEKRGGSLTSLKPNLGRHERRTPGCNRRGSRELQIPEKILESRVRESVDILGLLP